MRRIFLDGVDRSRHSTAFLVWYEFLHHAGVPDEAFDMESLVPPKHPPAPTTMTKAQVRSCGAYSMKAMPVMHPGDYLIVGPDSLYPLRDPGDGYDLVFRTSSPFHVPFWTLKTAIKVLLLKAFGAVRGRRTGWLVNGNWSEPVDYYVYRKQ